MKKVFHSKIGLELFIPIATVVATVIILLSMSSPKWLGIVILLPVILFIIHLFMNTHYTIKGDLLKIKCGFLFNKTINIQSITKISETTNPMSAPATSLDRLEIRYNTYDYVIISPKHKRAFIEELISLKPTIEIKTKQAK